MSTNQLMLVIFLFGAAYVATTQAQNNSSDSNSSDDSGDSSPSSGGNQTVSSEATFDYNYGATDLTDTSSQGYVDLKNLMEAALLVSIKASVGDSCMGITITEMSAGSLVIKFLIIIDATANPDYATSANAAMAAVASGGISVGGQTLAATNVLVGGAAPDSASSKMMVSMVAVGACVLATALTCN